MAWTTALGSELESTWKALLAGHTGFRVVPSGGSVRNLLAASVPTVPLSWTPAERLQLFATSTIQKALEHAGITTGFHTVRLIAGTSLGAALDETGAEPLHRWADNAAQVVGLTPNPVLVSTACSAGSDSLLVAAALLAEEPDVVVVCGAADILTQSKRLGHTSLGTMSPTQIRPFDQRGDGMLLGEGAGFMVLETAAAALRRGAVIRGVIRGAVGDG